MDNERYENIIKQLTRIETLLENYKETQIKAEEAHSMASQNKADIKEIKDKMKFLGNTITTGVVGIVIAAIVFVIKMMK
jgi:predicted  nucleic acid-binding Zn-ribbon protein